MIEIKDLNFKRDNFSLKIDSLSFRKGEKTALLGENGSGKSTLLHILSGVIETDSVYLEGVNISQMQCVDRARFLSFLPQFSNVSFPLSVRETVELGAFSKKSGADADKYMEMFDISHLKERDTGELSGGEMRRVMLARVFCQETDSVLLDEPASNLDIRHRLEILRLLQESAKTIICSMHEINEALQTFERFIFLKNGELAADCTADSVTGGLLTEVYGVQAYHTDNGFAFSI